MKKAAALALATLLAPSSLMAATQVGPVELSANVAMLNDYVWRGVSQTNENPAIQGGFDASHELGFYLGLWASNVDFNNVNAANIEIDFYGGWTKKWENGLGVDVGMIHYEYPGEQMPWTETDFNELYLGASYSFMGANVAAKYFHSSDFANSNMAASYVDLKADYTFPMNIVLTGHYGFSFGKFFDRANGPDGYNDYSVTLGTELAGFGLEAGWYGTDDDAKTYNLAKLVDDRAVLKLSRKF